MFRILFLLFIAVPILEIMVLINVGGVLGALPTICLVIITAWLGATLVKQQGVATMQSMQEKMASGQMPSDEIIASVLLLVAGVTLLTPGFITDTFGLLLLWPVSRQWIVNKVKPYIVAKQGQSFGFGQGFQSYHQSSSGFKQDPFSNQSFDQEPFDKQTKPREPSALEGEFERKD
ncbi:FxsA family protein [Thalassotalea sp. PS06]|uniref:FxsA family protein n=1 Tax=Thalassotalea sp. PS06 TaxID=2594005 RepID=UPI001164C08F|nr:FxsA family protein [Thalassotalea sp. PS06]QDP02455.1 FxsA family protein [Thalassotalea sp. PS06]